MSGPDAESSSVAVLAEKPSVARDIARVLGATKQGQGYLHGNGYVVTWAIGHLVALAQPHEIQPEWKHWRRDLLPMLPREWPLVVYEKTQPQFALVHAGATEGANACLYPRGAEASPRRVESACQKALPKS
jgi:DNA topoisomerase-3